MKKKPINKVVVQGYLKENNLELVTVDGGKVIRGMITIATDAHQSFRLQFYKKPTKKDGSEDKTYTALSTLLPANTVSIKKLLEGSSGTSFDVAKESATKLWVYGSLDEYAYYNDANQEVKMTTLKGSTIGTCDPEKFVPEAKFEIDCYIKAMRPETKLVDEDVVETGRLIIEGLVPNYPYEKADMFGVTFVTDDKTYTDDAKTMTVSAYINDNWHVGETVNARGNLVNLMVSKNVAKAGTGFGMSAISNSTETEFIEERLILGGSATGINADEDGQAELGFTSEDVKTGLTLRVEKVRKNTEKKKKTGANSGSITSANGFSGTKGSEDKVKDFGLGKSFGAGGFNPTDF